jgi:hypothetical protein
MGIFINKIIITSLILLGIGILSLIAENTFYQYVDNDGFLHESLFLPLGVISLFLGMLCLIFFIIQRILRGVFKKNLFNISRD